jgi:hypothetical protein
MDLSPNLIALPSIPFAGACETVIINMSFSIFIAKIQKNLKRRK